jgi:hypothetical protein
LYIYKFYRGIRDISIVSRLSLHETLMEGVKLKWTDIVNFDNSINIAKLVTLWEASEIFLKIYIIYTHKPNY